MSTGSKRWAATALFAAAMVLTTGCSRPVDLVLPESTPPLHRAAAADDAAQVKALLKGDPAARGPYGWTALHVAAMANAERAAKALLAAGARTNVVDEAGMTPLHWAARRGATDAVEVLLAAKAELHALNKFDMTPLHEASTVDVAEVLLERGARLDARDVDGMTPLHTAPNKKVADLYIDRGANVNARAIDGRTPMDMPPGVVARKRASGK